MYRSPSSPSYANPPMSDSTVRPAPTRVALSPSGGDGR